MELLYILLKGFAIGCILIIAHWILRALFSSPELVAKCLHKWAETGTESGQTNVLKCQKCKLVFGPHDEHGRPNPEWK